MMAQPFTFPPPPPPPARREALSSPNFAQPNYTSSYGSGTRDRGDGFRGGRGRGDALRGRGFSGRGRGAWGTYGGHCGTKSFNQNSNGYRQNLSQPQGPREDGQFPQQSVSSAYHGQKRPYSIAFNKPSTAIPRPQAAPAVPSFGGDLLSSPAPQLNLSPQLKKRPRQHNQLGLTPTSQNHESSSGEDEEAKLADTTASGAESSPALLQFEYKGRTATLQTAADIAAWIAERRKNFPTAAKAEAARKEAEEKRRTRTRRWEEEEESKKERADGQRFDRLQREKVRQEELRKRALESVVAKQAPKEEDDEHVTRKTKEEEKATKAALKTEKLKRKLEKAQRDARKAKEALERMQQGSVITKKDVSDNAGASKLPSKSLAIETFAIPPPSERSEPKSQPSDGIANLQSELLKDEDATPSNVSAISLSDIDETDSDSEATSSSGSSSDTESNIASDSDLESSPEELTSKRTAPDRVLPPPRVNVRKSSPTAADVDDSKKRVRNPCRNMLRTGRCQFGGRCRYSHDLSGRGRDAEGRTGAAGGGDGGGGGGGDERVKERKEQDNRKAKTTGRKSLYQALVEKEVEEERRVVLQVVMEMGNRGMLEEPAVQGGSEG